MWTAPPTPRRPVRAAELTTQRGREMYQTIRKGLLTEEQRLLAELRSEIRQALPQFIARLARAAAARVETGNGSCCRVP